LDDTKKKARIPTAPSTLHSSKEAKALYRKLYQLLIDQDRGEDKYKYSVAIAANSLYFYELTLSHVKITEDTKPMDVGRVINAINAASMEWGRAAKVLLLTPESELKIIEEVEAIEDAEPPPTLADVMGELLAGKSKNPNYSKSNKGKAKIGKTNSKKSKV